MRRENAAASAPKIGPAVMIEDPFDPSNQQATLIQQHMSDNNVDLMDPTGSDYAAEYDDPNKSHPIRLASKTILSHLVNHLFHFPMCAGRKSTNGPLLSYVFTYVIPTHNSPIYDECQTQSACTAMRTGS